MVERFKLTPRELDQVKDIYLCPASSREYDRLIVIRRFFEDFNLMARRGIPTSLLTYHILLMCDCWPGLFVLQRILRRGGTLLLTWLLSLLPSPLHEGRVWRATLLVQGGWGRQLRRSSRRLLLRKVLLLFQLTRARSPWRRYPRRNFGCLGLMGLEVQMTVLHLASKSQWGRSF